MKRPLPSTWQMEDCIFPYMWSAKRLVFALTSTLLIQRQSATFPDLDLTILPTPGDCAALKTQGMHFEGVLSGVDPTFTGKTFDPKTRNGAGCYLQPRI